VDLARGAEAPREFRRPTAIPARLRQQQFFRVSRQSPEELSMPMRSYSGVRRIALLLAECPHGKVMLAADVG